MTLAAVAALVCAGGAADASTVLGTDAVNLRHDGVTYFDMTDPENNGAADANTNYNAFFTSTNEPGFGGGEYSFNVFDNRVGGGSDKWCCDDPGAGGHQLTAQFGQAITLTSFTITSSNDSSGRDPTNWEIQGSNDGVNYTPIYTHPSGNIFGARNQVILFEAGSDYTTPAAYSYIRYDVTDTASGGHALNELEYFDSSKTTMFPPPPPPTPVARLTGPAGLDMLGGAYGESVGVASAPTSWTLEEAGTPTLVAGIRETIWDGALPNGDVTDNIENVRAAAAGPLGANDAQGILTTHLHYNADGNVDARAAALGAPGFDAGNFTMLWETIFTPDESGQWDFRFNRTDDRGSVWIDKDQDGVFSKTGAQGNERIAVRTGCCGGANGGWGGFLSGEQYLLGIVMNDTGGGGYWRDTEFSRPSSGAWIDLNPSATGNLFTTLQTSWTTVATGSNQVGDVSSDGLFGASLAPGSHHLRLTVVASGQSASAEGDFVAVNLVPEPMTMLAVGMGIASIGGYIRKRRRV